MMLLTQLNRQGLRILILVLLSICSATATAEIVNVYDGAGLHSALRNAEAGDEIVLQPGFYRGTKTESPENKRHYFYSHRNGTARQPIIVRSYATDDKQSLQGDSTNESGYVFYLTGNHWIIKDLKFHTGQKGIMLDSASHNTLDNIEVFNTRDEAVHFRQTSHHNVLSNCYIHDTGKRADRRGYAEAVYIGSHEGDELGDRSNFNRIGGCQLGPNVTAELIDIKEGTENTIVEFNTLLGDHVSGQNYADSFIDIKGNDVVVRNNRLDANGNSIVDHGIHILKNKQHQNSNIYDNQVTLNNGSAFIKIGGGLTHVDNNKLRFSAGQNISYSTGEINNNLDNNLPNALSYTGYTSEIVDTNDPSNFGNCYQYQGRSKTELDISEHPCIEVDQDLKGRLVQFWDSNENISCNFRGGVSGNNESFRLIVSSNYVNTRQLAGNKIDIQTSNDCGYLIIRIY